VAVAYFDDTLTGEPYTTLLDSTAGCAHSVHAGRRDLPPRFEREVAPCPCWSAPSLHCCAANRGVRDEPGFDERGPPTPFHDLTVIRGGVTHPGSSADLAITIRPKDLCAVAWISS
jgi:hypothetical protein